MIVPAWMVVAAAALQPAVLYRLGSPTGVLVSPEPKDAPVGTTQDAYEVFASPIPPPAGAKVKGNRVPASGLATLEYGYEVRGPFVFAERDGAFQILQVEPKPQLVWTRGVPGEVHLPFEKLEHLSFLTQHWDGTLRDAPGGSKIEPRYSPPRKLETGDLRWPYVSQIDIDVIERRAINDVQWVKVRLVEVSHCLSKDGKDVLMMRRDAKGASTKEPVSAWAPLRSEAGALNFWYYPRGC